MSVETLRRYRDEKWTAEFTGRKLPTLRNDRSLGRGIPFYRFGKSIRYREDEVIAWCESRRVETSR